MKKRVKKPPNVAKRKLHQQAWTLARAMMEVQLDKTHVNEKTYCPECKQQYCLGADNVEQFCKNCFYNSAKEQIEAIGGIFTGCTKKIVNRRVCRLCLKIM